MTNIEPQLSLSEKNRILNEFECFFQNHDILKSPFLQKLENGELSKEQIKLWISQQFYFSTQFPRCLAALYSRIEDFEISRLLINFLSVEHWGSTKTSAHWKMFVMVLNFFDLKIEKLKTTEPFEETINYLNYRLKLCFNATIEEGLGAMGYGHELVNAKIFESYLKGIENIPGVSEDTLKYFKAHVEDEREDYEIFKKIIISICKSEENLNLVKKGALSVLEQRQIFFEKILERIKNP